MKNVSKWKRNAVIFLSVISVPATLWAIVTDTSFDIGHWGSIGWNNTASLGSGGVLLIGQGNSLENFGHNALAVGSGLIIHDYDSAVIGAYNADTHQDEQFIVGNGVFSADGSGASNSLEIYKDGTIKIGRQGDILMGEFGINGD